MESIKLMCPQALPLLPRSRIGCCPQLHWTDALSLNTTAQRHYSGLQGCNPTEKMHYSSWPRSRTHPSPYEALQPLPMVMSYGPNNWNFPGLDRIFPEGKIRQIRGENLVSSHLVPHVHPCIWLFQVEISSVLLWDPRNSEKGDLL